jgi:RNA polymerase sigma factor (sigma-70 family)
MSAVHDMDEALLLSGDPEDFGRFYDRYVESLLAYFQRRLRDPEAAADLTAETFAAALAARGRFRARPAPATAWLFRIAQHKLVDHRRHGSAQLRTCERLGMERVPVEEEDAELIRWLGDEVASQLVDELPPEQRDAIRAHVLEDREYHEIARSEAISEAAVRKRVSRGLGALRNRLGGAR